MRLVVLTYSYLHAQYTGHVQLHCSDVGGRDSTPAQCVVLHLTIIVLRIQVSGMRHSQKCSISLYGKCGDKPRAGIAGNRTSFLFHNSNATMHAIAIVIVILLHTMIVFIKPLLCSINGFFCDSSIC